MSNTNTPLLFNSSGPVATPPATLLANLIALVQQMAPGYTASLPGSLIEDLSSTAVGALITQDQGRVDSVSNVTPYGANAFVLAAMGQMLGVPQGGPSNGNVDVVFAGTPGYVIPKGFIISDGTNQYSVQSAGVIGAGGFSQTLFAVATNSGIFAIPSASVNVTVTSVPSPYALTVTNALAGVSAQAAQTIESYRAQVLEAMQVAISGTQTYLKTLLYLVPGVSQRLVSVLQVASAWEILCGGGDPYQIAGAIYASGTNIGLLAGSQTTIRNVNASLFDAPNTYNVVFVNPPQQVVTVAATWNTTLTNFTAAAQVNQLISGAEQAYINSIIVGQPINLLVLQEQVQTAIADVLAPVNLTKLSFAVTINSIPASPTAGTSIIPSDPESYFFCSPSGATSVQG